MSAAEALEREVLPKCMDEADARALAGVFVDMVRQQHAQRRVLVKQGAEQLWKEADQLTDCCRCKRLSYITVAIDNMVSSVSAPSAQHSLLSSGALSVSPCANVLSHWCL